VYCAKAVPLASRTSEANTNVVADVMRFILFSLAPHLD
jgi:hypothetical protein